MRRILEYSLVILAMSFSMMAYGQDDKTKKDAQAAAAEAAQVLADTPEVVVAPPKPVYWTNTLTTTVNFAQTSFTSWAAGGNNNYTLNSIIRGDANWAREKKYWNNHLEFDYGFLYSQDKPIIQKSVDRTFITSTWGYKVKEKLNYTANFTFLNNEDRVVVDKVRREVQREQLAELPKDSVIPVDTEVLRVLQVI